LRIADTAATSANYCTDKQYHKHSMGNFDPQSRSDWPSFWCVTWVHY